MTSPDAPNPERKSNNALLCFCIGSGLLILSYFMGFGAALSVAFSGGDVVGVAGGLMMLVALVLAAISGLILAAIGGIWMIVRVIADQRGGHEEKRYRNVER